MIFNFLHFIFFNFVLCSLPPNLVSLSLGSFRIGTVPVSPGRTDNEHFPGTRRASPAFLYDVWRDFIASRKSPREIYRVSPGVPCRIDVVYPVWLPRRVSWIRTRPRAPSGRKNAYSPRFPCCARQYYNVTIIHRNVIITLWNIVTARAGVN